MTALYTDSISAGIEKAISAKLEYGIIGQDIAVTECYDKNKNDSEKFGGAGFGKDIVVIGRNK